MSSAFSTVNIAKNAATFYAARPADVPSLFGTVRDMMVVANMPQSKLALFDNHDFISKNHHATLEVQRWLLNRYWAEQLIKLPASTQVRYCLVPSGSIENWIKSFTTFVLPYVIQNNLPME